MKAGFAKIVITPEQNVWMAGYANRAKPAEGKIHDLYAKALAIEDSRGGRVGKYYGGPTWEHNDGSKVTGKQLAVSPGPSGAIPLQLVQTEPTSGAGTFVGTTYIQRINTVGGVAPAAPCDAGRVGTKQTVSYSADYVFYKSGS